MNSSFLIPLLPIETIRSWESYTIKMDSITSYDLMERAANSFCTWYTEHFPSMQSKIVVICGDGNNGGDGLAISRVLSNKGYQVTVVYDHITEKKSSDNRTNIQKLPKKIDLIKVDIRDFDFTTIQVNTIIIDSIFGTGLNRPVEGNWLEIIQKINIASQKQLVISVDIPSGLPSDTIENWECIQAAITFTFETPKLTLLLPETGKNSGDIVIRSIGLSPKYLLDIDQKQLFITKNHIKNRLKRKNKFAHKGTSGKMLQFCGSDETPGAAILSAKAAYRMGVGYVYNFNPDKSQGSLYVSLPEILPLVSLKKISSIKSCLIGCGIGVSKTSKQNLIKLLEKRFSSYIIDADALNILATNHSIWEMIPKSSILTPHPLEFDRLFGKHDDTLARIKTQIKVSIERNVIIILKGAHTTISDTEGNIYFNNSGNPGLAKAGSGDVLSGMIGALLAQGYDPLDAALIGVNLHGEAADQASEELHEWSINPSDTIDYISKALDNLHPVKRYK